MKGELFQGKSEIPVQALFLGQRLELRNFEPEQRLVSAPLMVSVDGGGCAVLFRYGVVVLFGLDEAETEAFLVRVAPVVTEPFSAAVCEQIRLAVGQEREGLEGPRLYLNDFSLERLQLVAAVLAKSVVLEYYETSVSRTFEQIEPLALELRYTGHSRRRARELLKHIGQTLSIQGRMVGRVEVLEKPDLLWDHPELERLYARLGDEYELSERHTALERKLDLISHTAETLLGLLMGKHTMRAEWYIVTLIAIAILLSLYDLFIQP